MSNTIRVLVPLFLLAALGAGEGPATTTDVTVQLTGGQPTEKLKLRYFKARPLVVESTVPRFLFEVPGFEAKDPIFFRVSLGESKGVPFYGALDRSKTGEYHDLLYLDRNRDQDLTNDGDPLKATIRTHFEDNRKFVEFLGASLDVPYSVDGAEVKVAYPCLFYYVSKSGDKAPLTIQIERAGWRQGKVAVGGTEYVFALIDDDCDGNYTTGDTWSMLPATADAARLLERDPTRSMLFPSWTTDQKLTVEVKSLDLAGRTAQLRIAPAKETEDAFFLRVAMARQSPEERSLKIDPRRPKADDRAKVKWLPPDPQKGVAYALKIANAPTVKKRVLLDFSAPNCIWCARMNRYTFRDREVVQLSNKFVCSKIAFKKGATDTVKYHVEGTPTYIVLALDGSEITRHAGFLRPAEFAAWLKSALR